MKQDYKLLTPGPLTTTTTVKQAMLVDHCTWDDDYKQITQTIRQQLLNLAQVSEKDYTSVLMQGSGSFCVESVISSVVGPQDKLLICTNGAYGERIAQMAKRYQIAHTVYQCAENEVPQGQRIRQLLAEDSALNMLAVVHNETTTGILNPLEELAEIAKEQELVFIVDAMSSFGGIPIEVAALGIDFLISSANKCIEGVPGFGFVICSRKALAQSRGKARTISLDLYDQFQAMEIDGKWRFTSPTHTVLAFNQALVELIAEGGVAVRHERYQMNNQILRNEMQAIGFEAYLKEHQGPFITAFYYPEVSSFCFSRFYTYLKEKGYAIYPGKVSDATCFRIGNIGAIYPEDMLKVSDLIKEYMEELQK
ncbi:2-aminoethylphosphonate--pyruvate transaminase [Vagococcus sp.]|uniref:2-aminoethylphosphonate--pyruvate transaminase n=1 Tax=Vagococcus sp. TaxID=1933889 RepID=UPI003F9C3A8A